MYGLVPYNLSPIQQGIQYGHALQEYNNRVFDLYNGESFPEEKANNLTQLCDAFTKWRIIDKTFIILNGGTTNKTKSDNPIFKENECNIYYKGSLNNHLEELNYNKVDVAEFYEPDLGDQLTAVVFLVDERVWDKEKYPDLDIGLQGNQKYWDEWVESIGGEKNLFLRDFVSQFRLA